MITAGRRCPIRARGERPGRLPDPVGYGVDWSEQQHHLSGELGRLLLARALRGEWVVRAAQNRSVRGTDRGRAAFREHVRLDW